MARFRDEILKLTNPTPTLKDPEDNSDDETAAKVVQHEEDYSVEEEEPSKLRSQVANILSETDVRYAGKKTSRKNLDESFSADESDGDDEGDGVKESEDEDMVSEEEAEDNDEVEGSDEEDDIATFQSKVKVGVKQDKFSFTDDGDYDKYGDDDDEKDDDSDDDDDDDSDETDDDDEDESEIEDDDEEGDGIASFSAGGSDDVAKGQAAKQQLVLWDSLLEGRIKLQKAVTLVNQLPQGDTWQRFTEDSPRFAEESGKAQQAVKHLLDSLVHLQDLLLAQNKETSHMVQTTASKGNNKSVEEKPDKSAVNDSEDEEILSDEDMDKEEPAAPAVSVRKRKMRMEEYPGALKKQHDAFLQYRDTTIQKWYDRTRLAGGSMKGKNFSAFDQSALVQINQILADRERLVKRTQLKRTTYRVLGNKPKPDEIELVPTEETEDQIPRADEQKDYDEEIFDDDDFYHQLLRELIEKKASDTNDPVALSRQWLEIQKLRTKSKRKIDTRASKGRKIRYHVHKKMVNFMAPLDNCAWSHEARDDLFKSLFGKQMDNSSSV